MQEEAENPRKLRHEKTAVVLSLLALIVSVGTCWEIQRAVAHGDVKDRPRLKIAAVRISKQDDHFVNLLLMVENHGESSATLNEISSRPLTGSVEKNSENQECYNELGNAKPFINPDSKDQDEILKDGRRPIVLLVELPPHCIERVDILGVEINLTYKDPFKNIYLQHEYIRSKIQK